MTRPIVLGAGSCLIGHFLRGLKELSNNDSFEFVSSNTAFGDRAPVPDDQLSRCALVIEEASPWKKYRCLSDEEIDKIPASCPTVLVPTIHFNSLWPLLVHDPRNVPEEGLPWGRFPFSMGDRLALRVRETEPDPNRWLQVYMSTDVSSVVNLKRNHELELYDMFAREEGCDIHIAAYVASNFRRSKLFFTHHHPTAELLTFALTQILAHSAVAPILARERTAAIDGVSAWVERERIGVGEDSPVHPGIAAFFGLQWYRPDATYQWLGQTYTFEEWADYYLHYEPPVAPTKE